VLTPVAADANGCAAPDADAADVEDVIGLKVSLLGDCQIGKTSFMVSINFLLLFYIFPCLPRLAGLLCPCFSFSSPTNNSYVGGTTDLYRHFLLAAC
jgi:hypothetical protein